MNDKQFGELVNELDKLRRAHPELVPECKALKGKRLQLVAGRMFSILSTCISFALANDKDQS